MALDTKIVERPLLPALRLAYEVVTDDPVEAAERVAAFHGMSTEAYINFAEAFAVCLKRFLNKERQLAFLNRLAELGVISRRDAMVLSRPNGMLSMIKKIGENAHWLRRPEILPLLVPEPSKLYQIVLLHDGLDGDFDRALSKLKILEPGYTRDEIIALREEDNSVSAAAQDTLSNDAHDLQGIDSPEVDPRDKVTGIADRQPLPAAMSGSVVSGSAERKPQAFDLISVKCTGRDLRRLRTDFANANELDRLLRRPVLAPRAALVVFTRVADIAAVETRLLPHLGFVRLEHVFAIGQPTGPDLASQPVALVSIRGLACTLPRNVLSSEHSLPALAQHLFPQANGKAQVFGEPEEGWTSFDWSEEEA